MENFCVLMEVKRTRTGIETGGADGDRTRYLIVANDALYQMSYSPELLDNHTKSCPNFQHYFVIIANDSMTFHHFAHSFCKYIVYYIKVN